VSNAGIKFFWVITYTEITSTIKDTASFLCTQLLFVLHLLLGIVYCLLPRFFYHHLFGLHLLLSIVYYLLHH
jgi:hypothetical protein